MITASAPFAASVAEERRLCASLDEFRDRGLRQVEHAKLVARLDQVGRHRAAHIAKPDKSDCRHASLHDLFIRASMAERGVVKIAKACR